MLKRKDIEVGDVLRYTYYIDDVKYYNILRVLNKKLTSFKATIIATDHHPEDFLGETMDYYYPDEFLSHPPPFPELGMKEVKKLDDVEIITYLL